MANKPVEFYKDKADQWRWRVRNKQNNKIVAAASEGFASKERAMENYDIASAPQQPLGRREV